MRKQTPATANWESLILTHPVTWFVFGALVIATAMQPPAHAINIIMEYNDAGSTPPHPENSMWNPDGSILIQRFQAAEANWRTRCPVPTPFSFLWDNDIREPATVVLN
jgi:hypothetical protein